MNNLKVKASSDHLLGQGNENIISKIRGQPSFKVYYGIMRKAAIIASIQQRGLKKRMIAKNGNHDKLLYWKDHCDFEDVIENEGSQCENDFSDSNMANTEIKATESSEENLRVPNFTEDITQVSATKSEEDNITILQGNVQESQNSTAFSNELEPHATSAVQEPKLHTAFHNYEYQKPPRMAIVLPNPIQGRTVWVDPTDYISRMRQYSGSLHTRMKLPSKEIWCLGQTERKELSQDQIYTTNYMRRKLCDIIGSLQSAADSIASRSQMPASSTQPKYKAFVFILAFLLLILSIIVFYFIWSSPLPEEIRLTLSGVYSLLISFLYSQVNW